MYRILYSTVDIAVTAPIAVGIYLILSHKRRALGEKLTVTAFVVYLCAVFSLVGVPTVDSLCFDANIDLVPFRSLFSDTEEVALNVLLFVPLGFFLAFLWKRYRSAARIALAGASLSLVIELSQLFTHRATDVTDLVTNTLGAIAGYLLFALFRRVCDRTFDEPIPPAAFAGLVLLLMFTVTQFISERIWLAILS